MDRLTAIRIIDNLTDRDDPFWEDLMIRFGAAEDDLEAPLPTLEDLLGAFGVTPSEIRESR